MKVLVTGVNGFVGKYMVHELVGRDHEVIGVAHSGPADGSIASKLKSYITCDLTDAEAVKKLPLNSIDSVIGLAGLAQIGGSFADPEKYQKVNTDVLVKLGERMVEIGSTARILAVSTGAVYDPNQPPPLTEDSKLIKQGSPYAISKLMMENAAQDLRQQGLDVILTRPFNHSGPGQGRGFLMPDLYAQIIESSITKEPVKVGRLDTKRDHTDVRDVVRAYADLVLEPNLNFDLYNVCSGQVKTGQYIFDLLIKYTGLSDIKTEQDQALIRPNDPLGLRGSFERLHQETGWQPKIPFEQTVKDFIASAGS